MVRAGVASCYEFLVDGDSLVDVRRDDVLGCDENTGVGLVRVAGAGDAKMVVAGESEDGFVKTLREEVFECHICVFSKGKRT